MPERSIKLLRLACIILAGLLVYQIAKIAPHWNPLARVTIPVLPTLSDSNDAAAAVTTNSVRGKTNAPNSTNLVVTNIAGTNVPEVAPTVAVTNPLSTNEISKTVVMAQTTNVPLAEPVTTATPEPNKLPQPVIADKTTNLITDAKPSTNANSLSDAAATKAALSNPTNITATNVVATKKPAPKHSEGGPMNEVAMAALNGGPNRPGRKVAPLAPAMQARISRITDSEIFAPVMHPMPAALMGIAGKVAFLRAASGQTGMVKEGDSLGELKLIRIGINRVLVEADGDKKELMMFNGFGGESLLSKTNDVSHEPITPLSK